MLFVMSKVFIREAYLKSYDATWRAKVEGEASSQELFFRFSKPSPFSSMTEMAAWLADRQ